MKVLSLWIFILRSSTKALFEDVHFACEREFLGSNEKTSQPDCSIHVCTANCSDLLGKP